MKENLIPTKDLKTGAKVFGVVVGNVFEAAKPTLSREAGKAYVTTVRKFRKPTF